MTDPQRLVDTSRLLAGRVALVTGAARGIGLAIATRFAAQGATVCLTDLDEPAVTAAAAELGPDHLGVVCDVADEDDVVGTFAAVVRDLGRLDVVVNNAGITRDGMLHRMPVEDFRTVVDVHLQGTWLCSREAVRHMRGATGGAIVNLSSVSGKVGNLGQSNYAAAKAGIVGLTKSTAREGARHGIRANAIQPGLIRTAMTEAMTEQVWEDKLASIPLGRAGEPAEVADVALFLASDLSSYVTGAVVEVGGGRHM